MNSQLQLITQRDRFCIKPLPEWVAAVIALYWARAGVIEEHLKTGHPLIMWRDGKVYRQPPEEAKRELEEVLKNEFWASIALPIRFGEPVPMPQAECPPVKLA